MPITNETNIPIVVATWLINDDYDYVPEDNYISATGLLKPTKSIILSQRVQSNSIKEDLNDYGSRALGTSIHTAIEYAWKLNYKENLKRLGYPQAMIDRVKINPTKEELTSIKNCIPIYIEQRSSCLIDGYKIGGKFDFIVDGELNDNKSTSVYTVIFDSKADDYIKQGSIYKFLNPDKVTKDTLQINFILTDWSAKSAKIDKDYPQSRFPSKRYKLLSRSETELFIKQKLTELKQYASASEEEMPECTNDELWRSDTKYKYYKDPSKTERSTKNFATATEAYAYMASKGNVGIIKEVLGEVRRCKYCNAASICKQRQRYFND